MFFMSSCLKKRLLVYMQISYKE